MSQRPSVRLYRVFVDTSAYFALTDARAQDHAAGQAIQTRLISERWRLFTTNFVLAEIHALALTRLGRAVAARVLRQLDESTTTIIRASAADERRAREIIFRYDDKDFSLTDAISFAVIERLGITQAFTFDRHFAQYGLTVLTPDQL